MAISSVGYGGTVDYPDYARGLATPARYTFDGATSAERVGAFRQVIQTSGNDRTIRVYTKGVAQGWGIRDTESASYVDFQFDPVSSGTRWDMLVLRRDWSAKETELISIPGGSSRGLPSRNVGPGVIDDQPVCLVRLVAGEAWVQEIVDLRCWAGDGGLVAVDTMALDYLDTPGTRVNIGTSEYTRILSPAGAASWDVKAPPQDTGWLALDRGQFGYLSSGRYRVQGGWAVLNVDLLCASDRPAGTVEIAPGSSVYAHSGNDDMRFALYCTTDGRMYPARVFRNGKVNAYGLPRMDEGDRIYGTMTWPVG